MRTPKRARTRTALTSRFKALRAASRAGCGNVPRAGGTAVRFGDFSLKRASATGLRSGVERVLIARRSLERGTRVPVRSG
jgi:hypothetical protein